MRKEIDNKQKRKRKRENLIKVLRKSKCKLTK